MVIDKVIKSFNHTVRQLALFDEGTCTKPTLIFRKCSIRILA